MRFLIVGAAGHAQEVAWSLREQEVRGGRSCEILFFDDAVPNGRVASRLGDVVGTLGDLRDWDDRDDAALVLGVGVPALKTVITERLAPVRLPWATVVHPAATVGPNCRIREGSYIAAGAIVTVNCTIGRFVTINMHCQVAHDDVLEDLVTLHPDTHLGGNVRVEEGAELGTGSIVLPGLTVGARAVLGAGCTVVRSLSGHATYVGVPAGPVVRRKRATGGSFAR
jgi:sugar O-acyltransferase (sialic acid O-acetyltransferase NeuD family)